MTTCGNIRQQMDDATVMKFMVLHELRLCSKYKSEVESCVKRIKCQQCFKNRKKTLNATSLKYLICTYSSDFYYFSTYAQSSLNFHQLIYKICLSWLTGQAVRRSLLCPFQENEMSDPVCWGKCPDYGYPWVNFSLKMHFRSTQMKNIQISFPLGLLLICCS